MNALPGRWPQWMRLGLAWMAVLLLASGCAVLPAEFERTPSKAVPLSPDTTLGRIAQCRNHTSSR